MNSKKKDRKIRFLLAPRPQRDPLAADNDAPQNVLIPKDGTDINAIRERLPDFDPQVFASSQQTKKGMLERAHNADGVTFDPDILEAMSKDFDFDDPNNVLDDDFMDQAGGLIEDEGEMLEGEEDDLFDDVEPEVIRFDKSLSNSDSDAEDDFDERDELRSNSDIFTNYSLTSSVMRRSQGLQQIDEHFERLYEKEYADDTEIGPLDLNEVKGDELLSDINQIKQLKREVKVVRKRNHGDDYEPEIVSEHHKNAIIGDDPAEEERDLVEIEIQRRENKIDCESVLSYNSNLYNHPRLIIEPRRKNISQSTNDQMEVDQSDCRSRSGRASMASTCTSVLSKLSIRPANESLEDKRARKKALKQYRQERRQIRKQNQQIFKSELANVTKQQRLNQPVMKLA